jgi:hypothetical protein
MKPNNNAYKSSVHNWCCSSLETLSSSGVDGSKSDSTVIAQDESPSKPFRFINSENVLYKFKLSELEESSSYDPEYTLDQGDNGSHNDITTVLFTRRKIEQEAKNFVANLRENTVIQNLEQRISRNSTLNCCWPRAPLLPLD